MLQAHHRRPLHFALLVVLSVAICTGPGKAAWLDLAGGPDGSAPAVSVRALSATLTEVTIDIPGVGVRSVADAGAAASLLVLPGSAPTIAAGHPELPVLVNAITLPPLGDPRLEVVAVQTRRLAAPAPRRSQGPGQRSDGARAAMAVDTAADAGLWPATVAELGRPFLLRDQRGVALRLYPARWDHDRREYELVVSITLLVVTEGHGGVNPGVRPAAPARSLASLRDAFFAGQAGMAAAKTTAADAASPERLLIVTTSALRPALVDLADWKRACGYEVEVLDIAALGGQAAGIQDAVQARYDQPQGLSHLLLAGDATLVPTNLGGHEGAASDLMYGLIAGDDLIPDVLVSRLPARSEVELRTMVARTVAYERDPQPQATWYTAAIGVASDEGHPADYDRAEALRQRLLGGGFGAVARIYQGFGGSRAQIAAAVSAGASLINYLGHGAPGGWLSVPFGTADVHGLTNTTAWPWIVDVSCDTGDFRRDECFAAAWLRARHDGRPAGAVAVVAASTATTWTPPCVMQAAVVDHLIDHGEAELGALFVTGLASAVLHYEGTGEDQKLVEQFNLLGDGSLRVRWRRPEALLVSHAAQLPAVGEPLVVEAPAGARVALSGADDLLAAAIAPAGGPTRLTIDRALVAGEVVRLTVTAPNAIPYEVSFVQGGGVVAPPPVVPEAAALVGNWPNPFNPQTTVGVALAEAGTVRLQVLDARGRVVRTLADGHLPAGSHDLVWDGADLQGRPVPSGLYLARLTTARGTFTHKLTLAR